MPMYATEYRLPDGRPATTSCFARNGNHLEEVIKLRKMGERLDTFTGRFINPPRMASDLLRSGRVAAANHALIWTSMIAARAGVMGEWGLLNDNGLVHEIAHVMHSREMDGAHCSCRQCDVSDLAHKVERFERQVPGVHPCWGSEEEVRRPDPNATVLFSGTLTLEAFEALSTSLAKGSMAAAEAGAAMRRALPPAKPIVDPKRRGFARQQIAQGQAARATQRDVALKAMKARAKARPKPKATTVTLGRGRVFLGMDAAGSGGKEITVVSLSNPDTGKGIFQRMLDSYADILQADKRRRHDRQMEEVFFGRPMMTTTQANPSVPALKAEDLKAALAYAYRPSKLFARPMTIADFD